jgi:hypothetical protein
MRFPLLLAIICYFKIETGYRYCKSFAFIRAGGKTIDIHYTILTKPVFGKALSVWYRSKYQLAFFPGAKFLTALANQSSSLIFQSFPPFGVIIMEVQKEKLFLAKFGFPRNHRTQSRQLLS